LVKKHAFRLFCFLWLVPWAAFATPPASPSGPLQAVLKRLPEACDPAWSTVGPAALQQLSALYERQGYAALWTRFDQIDALLEQLDGLADDGLNPASYQPGTIRQAMHTATGDPLHRECSDIFASHAYLTALGHLARGRLPQDRLEPVWRNDAAGDTADTARLLDIASAGLTQLEQAFNQARPSLEQYHNLRQAYARLRRQPLPDDWARIPAGQTLRSGMTDPRVPALRQRLEASALLAQSTSATEQSAAVYGPELVEALKAFQRRHALQDDGVLGADTLTALNASPADRLAQLRVNLERFRWLSRDIEPRSLLVDIAGGRVIFFRSNSPQWEARSQVGRDTRQTPSIKSTVTRLTLNPTWTVPPTILREDKLPQIRANPAYLAEHKLQVLDYDGQVLDPTTVDWQNPGRILLRQAAGPDNPLGRVVIRFANPYSIYLHDTPSQDLFTRSQRTFSSGCVRVESVMQLIGLLLTEAEQERVAQLLQSGQTVEFRPSLDTPILLAYWTAEADSNGQPRYRPDVYHRDPALREALQAADRRPLLPGTDQLR